MPLGLNRTDLNKTGETYKDGTPITLPHEFGNVVNWAPAPAHFGNPIPSDGQEQNTVTWVPDPAHFGNIFGAVAPAGYLLQADGTSRFLLVSGGAIQVV